MKYATFILFGIFLIALGIANYKGNISTIHWYNRRKVSEADVPKYGRCMGLGTLIIGGSFILTAILELILQNELVEIVALIGCTIGVVIMLYGQFKYNKGIF